MAERVHSPGVLSDLASGLPPVVGDGRGSHSAIASFETVPLSANEPRRHRWPRRVRWSSAPVWAQRV